MAGLVQATEFLRHGDYERTKPIVALLPLRLCLNSMVETQRPSFINSMGRVQQTAREAAPLP